MNRLALIIKGHSNSVEENEADTTFVNSYFQFLNSIAGGAWDENEILFLDEPEVADYAEIIKSFKPSYALTILIGHGATNTDHQLFQLNENTIVKPGQFTLDTEKQLIIVESCRPNIEEINWVDLENKIPEYRNGGYVRRQIDRETAKYLFETQLEQCEQGIVVCYACSKNQSAHNYLFSSELIQFGQNLFLDTGYHYQTFDILSMMPYIIKTVKQKAKQTCNVDQLPEIHGNIDFPFAVSKFDLIDSERKKLLRE